MVVERHRLDAEFPADAAHAHRGEAAGVGDSDVRNNVPRPQGWMPSGTLDSWHGLVKMLEAHTEETITANQLKLFGYDKLEPLFRQAALSSPVTNS